MRMWMRMLTQKRLQRRRESSRLPGHWRRRDRLHSRFAGSRMNSLPAFVRFVMRRSFLLFAAAAATLAPWAASAQQAAATTRVVVQVSEADPARWNLALNNVRNLQDDVGADKVSIEIVAYGPGIGMLKRDAVTSDRIA